jgi:2-hydroxy-3-keto-5-methylthiopentenyl-1-phosphate phosphatase
MTIEPITEASSAGSSSDFRDELKHDAKRLKGTIGERAKHEATTRIDQATQAMGSASTALEAAAEKLVSNPETPDWMASAIQQAARKMDDLAAQINERNLDDIGTEVTQFARQNPGTFLAVSAAAGFAAARVLRAGVDKKRREQVDSTSSNNLVADDGYPSHEGDDNSAIAGLSGTIQDDIEGVAP